MKPFTTIAAVVFSLTVNAVIVPVWVSGIAFVIAGGLAVMLWREMRR